MTYKRIISLKWSMLVDYDHWIKPWGRNERWQSTDLMYLLPGPGLQRNVFANETMKTFKFVCHYRLFAFETINWVFAFETVCIWDDTNLLNTIKELSKAIVQMVILIILMNQKQYFQEIPNDFFFYINLSYCNCTRRIVCKK